MKILLTILLVLVSTLCGVVVYGGLKYRQLENELFKSNRIENQNTKIQQIEIVSLQKQINVLKKRKPIVVLVVPPHQEQAPAPDDSPSSFNTLTSNHLHSWITSDDK